MNDVIKQIGGFYIVSNSFYYTDTEYLYINKKYWSELVDNGFAGKTLGSGNKDYNYSGVFYAWFLAPKVKYCLLINDFGVIFAKKNFQSL